MDDNKQTWTVGSRHYDDIHELVNLVYYLRDKGVVELSDDQRMALYNLDHWIGHA